ncbi:MAG: hypothetical protein ACOH5I_04520 [Oligoflexus sp.]
MAIRSSIPSFLLIFISLTLVSCDKGYKLRRNLDYLSFQMVGGTVFEKPNSVTTKELHFDTGRMIGREVVIEGKIVDLGKFDTYLVLSDGVGRMLIVLTHIEEAGDILTRSKNRQLKVLGTVERGKKGLPYILAKSIKLVKKSKQS